MKPREECGVFGVMTPKVADVAGMSYYGLYALQHRGQESCGIVVNDDGVFSSHKDLGLVSDVFSKDVLAKLPQGKMAVGHVRHGTTGASNRNNCQPIEVNHQKGRMALAHNGNLSNAGKLRDELELSGAIFHSTSDTETIVYIITRERLRTSSIEEAVKSAVKYLEGAYSLVLMSPRKLICVRDPHGFRPLCYGKTEDGAYVIASESCGLSAVGARFIRDVEPGELIVFSEDGVISDMTGDVTERRRCIFEYIYFARPDSVLDGVSVHRARVKAGGAHRRFYRQGKHQQAHCQDTERGRGKGDTYEDIGAAFPLPMLLRNRYRLEGKSYSKFPHRQRNCRVDRSRFAGISAGGGAGEAYRQRRLLQRML